MASPVAAAVLREVRELNGERYLEQMATGLSDVERDALISDFADRIKATGRFPQMAALIEERVDPDASATREARFEFGLECLLDGVAARIPGSGP